MFTARSSFDVLRQERLRMLGEEEVEQRSVCPAYVPALSIGIMADEQVQ
jgi:hypothetical protein